MTTKTTKRLLPGSYSHGTMQPRDLLPRFFQALGSVDPEAALELRKRYQDVFNLVTTDAELTPRQDEDCAYLMEELFDELDCYCPDGFYFGAHPGDGADYGVWQCDNDL